MSVRNSLLPVFSILFLSACAAVTMPEGGPRDEKKPVLVSTNPANGATNFTSKTVALTFDEDIKPIDLNTELIITPNTGATYSTRTDRKILYLEFNEALEENTTYFLNFRNGIGDITEGNKAPETTLSFSTGNFLDTARVSGLVQDYLTQTPENNFTVALYPISDTANIRANKPYYFTRSNADGSFRIQNVKAGDYWIYAHQDKNNSGTYDQENEKIAYLPNQISINPVADSVVLKTVRLDTKKPFVLSVENFSDLNTLVFNEGIQQVSLQTLEKTPKQVTLPVLVNEAGKRVNVYPENGKLPATLLVFSTDSSGNKGIDTVKFNLANKPNIPAQLTFTTNKTELQEEAKTQVKFIFPVPVQVIGKNPFTIKEDTVTVLKPAYPESYTLNQNKTELTLTYTPKAKKTVSIALDSMQLLAINGKPFKAQTQQFTISRKANTGSISGSVKTSFKNYTVELLDDKGKILQSDKNLKKLNYLDLTPGNYQFRVKIDENNDGKWSLGDRKLKTLPEKLYVYPKPVSVRANWDIEDIDLVF